MLPRLLSDRTTSKPPNNQSPTLPGLNLFDSDFDLGTLVSPVLLCATFALATPPPKPPLPLAISLQPNLRDDHDNEDADDCRTRRYAYDDRFLGRPPCQFASPLFFSL